MLFEQTHISGISVKNRIIRSATHDGLADENGAPSDKLISKYEHLARNEIGCIITGYAAVSKNGVSPYPGMLRIYDDSVIEKYKELTSAVHKHNTPIVLQIAHCGRQTSSKAIGCQKVAPSDVLHAFYPDKAKVLDEAEIYCIIDDFVSMCRPFICEPDLAKKLKNGQLAAKCIMCNYCGLVIEKEPTKCLYGRV